MNKIGPPDYPKATKIAQAFVKAVPERLVCPRRCRSGARKAAHNFAVLKAADFVGRERDVHLLEIQIFFRRWRNSSVSMRFSQ